LLASLFKLLYEAFNLLFAADQAPDFANSLGCFLIGLNGYFHGCHIPFRHPVEAIYHLQEAFFYLFYCGGMISLFFYHLEAP
jgi:hypothetical protein